MELSLLCHLREKGPVPGVGLGQACATRGPFHIDQYNFFIVFVIVSVTNLVPPVQWHTPEFIMVSKNQVLFNLISLFLLRASSPSQLWRLQVFETFKPPPFSMSRLWIHILFEITLCLLRSWFQPRFELTPPNFVHRPFPVALLPPCLSVFLHLEYFPLQFFSEGYKQPTQP